MFNTVCYYLNVIGLSRLVAAIRFALVYTVFSGVPTTRYNNPDEVGYLGFVRVPWFGTLAFMRMDGSLQVRW